MCRFLAAAGPLEGPETLLAVPRGQETNHSAPGSMSRLPGEANILETLKCHPHYPGLRTRHDRTQTVQETQSRGTVSPLLFISRLEQDNNDNL